MYKPKRTHLSDVLEEGEVETVVLEPGQLEVAVHVGAVSVAVSQVLVVGGAVPRHRHTPACADTNWKAWLRCQRVQ